MPMPTRTMRVVSLLTELYDRAESVIHVEANRYLPTVSEVRLAVAPDVIDIDIEPDGDYAIELADGEQRRVTGWVILLVIESAVLEPRFIAASRRLPDGMPHAVILTATVRECLAELAGRREQILGPAAATNG